MHAPRTAGRRLAAATLTALVALGFGAAPARPEAGAAQIPRCTPALLLAGTAGAARLVCGPMEIELPASWAVQPDYASHSLFLAGDPSTRDSPYLYFLVDRSRTYTSLAELVQHRRDVASRATRTGYATLPAGRAWRVEFTSGRFFWTYYFLLDRGISYEFFFAGPARAPAAGRRTFARLASTIRFHDRSPADETNQVSYLLGWTNWSSRREPKGRLAMRVDWLRFFNGRWSAGVYVHNRTASPATLDVVQLVRYSSPADPYRFEVVDTSAGTRYSPSLPRRQVLAPGASWAGVVSGPDAVRTGPFARLAIGRTEVVAGRARSRLTFTYPLRVPVPPPGA